MRDGNRLKEKIELRLDQRQATSLVVVALLLAGALFGLGVMVGKNLAALPARNPPPPEALLDRLDAKARPTVDAASDGLTFQEDLTRRTPSPALSPPQAPPAIQPPSLNAPAVRAPPKTIDAGISAPTLTNPKPAVAASSRQQPPLAPEQPPSPPPGGTAIPPLPPPPESPVATGFTLQIKSTQSQDDANRFVHKLSAQGYHPFVVTADLPGKGRWYRIRLGKFESHDAADQYLKDFKRETKLDAFVTSGGK
jgi:DedD protein